MYRFPGRQYLIMHVREQGVGKCINIYDVRLEDTQPQCGMNWPPDLDAVYKYLAVSILCHIALRPV